MKNNLRQLIAFLILALGIYSLKDIQSDLFSLVIATGVVFLFWYLHSIKIALTNIRTIILLIIAFGFIFFAFRDQFNAFSPEHQTGAWLGGEMNPAQIKQLKSSHRVALELYFDHPPSNNERYFKEGVLQGSIDGVNYKIKTQGLDEQLMPEAKKWVELNLREISFEDQLNKVEKWWRKDFTYSLEPGTIPSNHPLDYFLFQSRIGFCEHYAAALSSILRLNGIPTRVAVGFYGGYWSPLLHTLTFEDADAHAWVEALNPSTHHWQAIDPTLWVNPNLNQHEHDYSHWFILLMVIVLAVALIYLLQSRNRDPRLLFLEKIEKHEKKLGLSTQRTTIADRIELLCANRTSFEKEMKESLSLYLKYYYQEDRSTKSNTIFLASLRKW